MFAAKVNERKSANRFANLGAALGLGRLDTTPSGLDEESNDVRRHKNFGEYRGFDYEEVLRLQVNGQTGQEHIHLVGIGVSTIQQ